MKPLLITVLTGSLAVNVLSNVLADGAVALALNLVSGVGVLAAGAGLWLTRERQEA